MLHTLFYCLSQPPNLPSGVSSVVAVFASCWYTCTLILMVSGFLFCGVLELACMRGQKNKEDIQESVERDRKCVHRPCVRVGLQFFLSWQQKSF